jgi:hypothetical protein
MRHAVTGKTVINKNQIKNPPTKKKQHEKLKGFITHSSAEQQ